MVTYSCNLLADVGAIAVIYECNGSETVYRRHH